MTRVRLLMVLAAILIAVPSYAVAAISEVASMRQTFNAGAFDSTTVAYPNNITVGQLLIAAGTIWDDTNDTYTVSVAGCSATFSVIMGTASSLSAGGYYRTFIASGVAGSTGACTLTIDPSPATATSYGSGAIDAFTCNACSLDVDGGTSTGTSTTVSDALTTLTADALIIGVAATRDGFNTTWTPGGSYTAFGDIGDATNATHNAVFRIATSATEYIVDWTIVASAPWAAQTVSFKESTGVDTVPFYKRRAQ